VPSTSENILNLIEMASLKGNRITSKEIAHTLNIERGPSSIKIRKRITKLIEEGHPIDATSSGYMYIFNEDQLNEYRKNLQSRIDGIEKRMEKVTENYYQVWGNIDE
jgi:biotin operon repressor